MKRFLFTIVATLCTLWSIGAQTTIFVCGDSTAATKDISKGTPERGWGHVLQPFFNPDEVVVENHAKNGRSTKSFVTLGHWQVVEERMKEGDYVLIEFGHNDGDDEADDEAGDDFIEGEDSVVTGSGSGQAGIDNEPANVSNRTGSNTGNSTLEGETLPEEAQQDGRSEGGAENTPGV